MNADRVTVLAVCVLLVLSVPWYFPAGSGTPLVFGFPLWGFVSLACYAAIAFLVVWRLPRLWGNAVRAADEDGE